MNKIIFWTMAAMAFLFASCAVRHLDAIYVRSDSVHGIMSITNLIALLPLSGIIVSETGKFFGRVRCR